jgi:hypothetical protein
VKHLTRLVDRVATAALGAAVLVAFQDISVPKELRARRLILEDAEGNEVVRLGSYPNGPILEMMEVNESPPAGGGCRIELGIGRAFPDAPQLRMVGRGYDDGESGAEPTQPSILLTFDGTAPHEPRFTASSARGGSATIQSRHQMGNISLSSSNGSINRFSPHTPADK